MHPVVFLLLQLYLSALVHYTRAQKYPTFSIRVPGRCQPGEYDCAGLGQCIDIRKFHDGRIDCFDGSDEYCFPGFIKCGTYCVDLSYAGQCLVNPQCNGGEGSPPFCSFSKEKLCPQPNTVPCQGYGDCVRRTWLMDGKEDCYDGSDEDEDYASILLKGWPEEPEGVEASTPSSESSLGAIVPINPLPSGPGRPGASGGVISPYPGIPVSPPVFPPPASGTPVLASSPAPVAIGPSGSGGSSPVNPVSSFPFPVLPQQPVVPPLIFPHVGVFPTTRTPFPTGPGPPSPPQISVGQPAFPPGINPPRIVPLTSNPYSAASTTPPNPFGNVLPSGLFPTGGAASGTSVSTGGSRPGGIGTAPIVSTGGQGVQGATPPGLQGPSVIGTVIGRPPFPVKPISAGGGTSPQQPISGLPPTTGSTFGPGVSGWSIIGGATPVRPTIGGGSPTSAGTTGTQGFGSISPIHPTTEGAGGGFPSAPSQPPSRPLSGGFVPPQLIPITGTASGAGGAGATGGISQGIGTSGGSAPITPIQPGGGIQPVGGGPTSPISGEGSGGSPFFGLQTTAATFASEATSRLTTEPTLTSKETATTLRGILGLSTTRASTTTTSTVRTTPARPSPVFGNECLNDLTDKAYDRFPVPHCDCPPGQMRRTVNSSCQVERVSTFALHVESVCASTTAEQLEGRAAVLALFKLSGSFDYPLCVRKADEPLVLNLLCTNDCTFDDIVAGFKNIEESEDIAVHIIACEDFEINDCDEKAECIPEGMQYRCECLHGTNDTSDGHGRHCEGVVIASSCAQLLGVCILFWIVLLVLFALLLPVCIYLACMGYRRYRKRRVRDSVRVVEESRGGKHSPKVTEVKSSKETAGGGEKFNLRHWARRGSERLATSVTGITSKVKRRRKKKTMPNGGIPQLGALRRLADIPFFRYILNVERPKATLSPGSSTSSNWATSTVAVEKLKRRKSTLSRVSFERSLPGPSGVKTGETPSPPGSIPRTVLTPPSPSSLVPSAPLPGSPTTPPSPVVVKVEPPPPAAPSGLLPQKPPTPTNPPPPPPSLQASSATVNPSPSADKAAETPILTSPKEPSASMAVPTVPPSPQSPTQTNIVTAEVHPQPPETPAKPTTPQERTIWQSYKEFDGTETKAPAEPERPPSATQSLDSLINHHLQAEAEKAQEDKIMLPAEAFVDVDGKTKTPPRKVSTPKAKEKLAEMLGVTLSSPPANNDEQALYDLVQAGRDLEVPGYIEPVVPITVPTLPLVDEQTAIAQVTALEEAHLKEHGTTSEEEMLTEMQINDPAVEVELSEFTTTTSGDEGQAPTPQATSSESRIPTFRKKKLQPGPLSGVMKPTASSSRRTTPKSPAAFPEKRIPPIVPDEPPNRRRTLFLPKFRRERLLEESTDSDADIPKAFDHRRTRNRLKPVRQLSSISEKSAEIAEEAALAHDVSQSAPNTTRSSTSRSPTPRRLQERRRPLRPSPLRVVEEVEPAHLQEARVPDEPLRRVVPIERINEDTDIPSTSTAVLRRLEEESPTISGRRLQGTSSRQGASSRRQPPPPLDLAPRKGQRAAIEKKIASRRVGRKGHHSVQSARDFDVDMEERLGVRQKGMAQSMSSLHEKPPWDYSTYHEPSLYQPTTESFERLKKRARRPGVSDSPQSSRSLKETHLHRTMRDESPLTRVPYHRSSLHSLASGRSSSNLDFSPYFDPIHDVHKPPKENLWWGHS